MPEPVVIVRGLSSRSFSLSSAMLKDLRAVALLSSEQLAVLHRELASAKGFLDPKCLDTIIRRAISDESTAQGVLRTLRNIGPDDVENLLDRLEEPSEDDDERIEESVSRALRRTLPALVADIPALRRFEKAERLATIAGRQLEAVDLICDLRPIFDPTRKHIEGMMPYTRLHLTVTGADGLPVTFEAELSEQQVHELADKTGKAKDKLMALRAAVGQWIPNGLPDLPLTCVPRKDSSDATT